MLPKNEYFFKESKLWNETEHQTNWDKSIFTPINSNTIIVIIIGSNTGFFTRFDETGQQINPLRYLLINY